MSGSTSNGCCTWLLSTLFVCKQSNQRKCTDANSLSLLSPDGSMAFLSLGEGVQCLEQCFWAVPRWWETLLYSVLLGTVTLSCFQGQSRFLWLRCRSSNWDGSSSSEVDLRVELYHRKYLKQWGCGVTRQMLTGVRKLFIAAWTFKMFPLMKVWCGVRPHFVMLKMSLLGNPPYLFLISTSANVILTAKVKNCSFS